MKERPRADLAAVVGFLAPAHVGVDSTRARGRSARAWPRVPASDHARADWT